MADVYPEAVQRPQTLTDHTDRENCRFDLDALVVKPKLGRGVPFNTHGSVDAVSFK